MRLLAPSMALALSGQLRCSHVLPAHAVIASHKRSGFDQLSYAHHKQNRYLDLRAGAPDRTRTCNRRLRRPMLYPIELRAQLFEIIAPTGAARAANHHRKFSHCFCSSQNGRGRGIRTLDIQLPKLALYQAELYPDRSSCSAGYAEFFQPHRVQSRMTTNCRHMQKRVPQHPHQYGAPGEIRTPDHQVRSLVLYPAELRARGIANYFVP